MFKNSFPAIYKILKIQKIVLSSGSGQGNFPGLEASRPRTSKCVLEDSTADTYPIHFNRCILPLPIDRQPRRFIYPKDGGRFDAPKMHVFTHLLRKCFTGKSKVRLRPPKSTIYGGSKWPLFTPKTAWIKIA